MSHFDSRDEAIGSGEGPSNVVHNQSVLKAVALIGCFVDSNGGKTLTELAKRTGMNVSTATACCKRSPAPVSCAATAAKSFIS